MDKLTQWIADNPVISTWITLISLIGVVITIIALVIQIRDKKRKMIHYTMTSNLLVGHTISKIDGIKVLFKDEEVNSVSCTVVKIWNGGNQLIEQTDFYPQRELKFIVPNSEKILTAIVIDEAEESCEFKIDIRENIPNEARILFYCLEPKQTATLNFYHTNVNEKETKLDGKLKGGKIINKSVEISTENGKLCVSTGKYKIYFDDFLGIRVPIISRISDILGVTIVKHKKESIKNR